MKVLVACEYSGTVRDAFIAKGHDAISCDLLPTDKPGPHYQGDIRDMLTQPFDLLIAHPPCTYLTNAGVRWLDGNWQRWQDMKEGAEFFKLFLETDIPKVAIENPIMHKYAKELIGRNQDQIVQPWMFGHLETKATCLWLNGLAPLVPTTNLKEETMALPATVRGKMWALPPSEDRWKLRSKTYQGLADAMAEQWG